LCNVREELGQVFQGYEVFKCKSKLNKTHEQNSKQKSFASQVGIKVRNVGDSFTPMAGSK
jgi:hypothetical protein